MNRKDPLEDILKRAKNNKLKLQIQESEDIHKKIEERVEKQREKERIKRESLKVKNVFLGLSSDQIEIRMTTERIKIEKEHNYNNGEHHLILDESKDFLLFSQKEMQLHFAIIRNKIDTERKKLHKN